MTQLPHQPAAGRTAMLARGVLAAAVAAVFAGPFAAPAMAQVTPERPQEDVAGLPDEPRREGDGEAEFRRVEPIARDADGSLILGEVEEEIDVGIQPAYSVDVGVTFTTAYFFRGILQEDQGFIAQPYFEVGIPLVYDEDKGFGVNAIAGIWNSFHSEQTGDSQTFAFPNQQVGEPGEIAGTTFEADRGGPSAWYESDLYAGIGFNTGDFELNFLYTFYTSPNGAFETIQEVGAALGYGLAIGDDPDSVDDFAIDIGLGAGVFFETKDGPGTTDSYLELGAEPGFSLELGRGDLEVGLSFPVTLGFSLEDYYVDEEGDNEFFGFLSVAAAAQVPLPVPERYGNWTLTPAFEYLYLQADSLEAINNGDQDELIGSLTLAFNF